MKLFEFLGNLLTTGILVIFLPVIIVTSIIDWDSKVLTEWLSYVLNVWWEDKKYAFQK